MKHFRSAYIEFGDGTYLLLWGDKLGMRQLSEALRSASAVPFGMNLSGICDPADGKPILLKTAALPSGMTASSEGFVWTLTPEISRDFADKVDVLTTSDHPGHQYLECDVPAEISVIVSCNEYPFDLL